MKDSDRPKSLDLSNEYIVWTDHTLQIEGSDQPDPYYAVHSHSNTNNDPISHMCFREVLEE